MGVYRNEKRARWRSHRIHYFSLSVAKETKRRGPPSRLQVTGDVATGNCCERTEKLMEREIWLLYPNLSDAAECDREEEWWIVLKRRFLWLMWYASTSPRVSGSTMTSPPKFTQQYEHSGLYAAETVLVIQYRQMTLMCLCGSRSDSSKLQKAHLTKTCK